jgi:hypothetical protein
MSWLITPELKTVEGIPWEQIPSALRWSPAEISTALWLDAADASTVTLVSGAVSQWNDKSGNGRHVAQATPTARPQIQSNELNGGAVIRFDGVNDLMLGDLTTTIAQPVSLFATTKKLSNPADLNARLFHASSSIAAEANIFLPLAATLSGDYVLNYGTNTEPAVAFGSQWHIYESIANGTSSLIRKDAVQDVTVSPGTNGCSRYFSIGGRHHDGLRNYNGDIAELVLIPGLPTTATRQRIEGYLAHKWGLTANLPSDHPYKTVAPTI